MLCFSLTGTLARLIAGADETHLAISSHRILADGEDSLQRVICVVREPLLRASIAQDLKVADIVRIKGEIEPRRREIKGVIVYDVVFVARWFEKLDALASTLSCEPAP